MSDDGYKGGPSANDAVGCLADLLKSANVDAGAALSLECYGEGAKIIGKRSGRTQNFRNSTSRTSNAR